MIKIENNTGIIPVINHAEATETTLHTWCHGDERVFKIVDEVPSGYIVWNIGRHNFPFLEFVPLAKVFKGTYHVDVTTLKAIRVKNEETALAILKEASRRGVNKSKFNKMSA